MKVMMTIGLALLISVSGWAQTTTATAVFQERNIVVDGSGNLAVFDSGRRIGNGTQEAQEVGS